MRLLIAGSRSFSDYDRLAQEVAKIPGVTAIISGMARGADALGARYAREHGIPLIAMPADWNTFGKSAGYRRNEEMAKIADMAIVFWDGQSRGTAHMMSLLRARGIHYTLVRFNNR